jgi:hypothetical protein
MRRQVFEEMTSTLERYQRLVGAEELTDAQDDGGMGSTT